MKIDRASEFVNYRRMITGGLERPRGFIKNSAIKESGADAVEISVEARMKYLNKTAIEKKFSSLHIGPDYINEIKRMIDETECDPDVRKERVNELRIRISCGAYDFDGRDGLVNIADIALSYMP